MSPDEVVGTNALTQNSRVTPAVAVEPPWGLSACPLLCAQCRVRGLRVTLPEAGFSLSSIWSPHLTPGKRVL